MASIVDLCASVVKATDELQEHYRKEDSRLKQETEALQDKLEKELELPDSSEHLDNPGAILRFNVGGDSRFALRRETLTCVRHSRLAQLFSGRLDQAFPRDEAGRIFLDVDPNQFRVIADWLTDVFRCGPEAGLPDPNICTSPEASWGLAELCTQFRFSATAEAGLAVGVGSAADAAAGVNDDDEDAEAEELVNKGLMNSRRSRVLENFLMDMPPAPRGAKQFSLLYRASRDGFTAESFHSKCDGSKQTVVVMRSEAGFVFGGYSGSAEWHLGGSYSLSLGAFLFRLDSPCVQSPYKHALGSQPGPTIYCHSDFGPTFGHGHGHDLQTKFNGTNATVSMNLTTSHHRESAGGGVLSTLAEAKTVNVTEVEVYALGARVDLEGLMKQAQDTWSGSDAGLGLLTRVRELLAESMRMEREKASVNKGIRRRRRQLETDIMFMKQFIDTSTEKHQIVKLNVSGVEMATTRATLSQCSGTLLADKFGEGWQLQDEELVDGGVFFNENPMYFATVLKFLRLKRLCGSSLSIDPPPMPEHSILAFDRFLDYLNLRGHMPCHRGDSVILSQTHMSLLHRLLGLAPQRSMQLNLLYRGSRDGFQAANFHAACDDVGNTVTVVRSCAGFIFGGFSGPGKWSTAASHVASEGAFLFRLDGPSVQAPSRHSVIGDAGASLYCHAGFGATFGRGYDLHVLNTVVKMNIGTTYSCEAPSIEQPLTTLAEGASIAATEIEVFAL